LFLLPKDGLAAPHQDIVNGLIRYPDYETELRIVQTAAKAVPRVSTPRNELFDDIVQSLWCARGASLRADFVHAFERLVREVFDRWSDDAVSEAVFVGALARDIVGIAAS
jgi:hypothetical protein